MHIYHLEMLYLNMIEHTTVQHCTNNFLWNKYTGIIITIYCCQVHSSMGLTTATQAGKQLAVHNV
jgi:hypothetical protein